MVWYGTAKLVLVFKPNNSIEQHFENTYDLFKLKQLFWKESRVCQKVGKKERKGISQIICVEFDSNLYESAQLKTSFSCEKQLVNSEQLGLEVLSS